MLAGIAVSGCDLTPLQTCVPVFLGDQFSSGRIWAWRAVAQGQLQGEDRNWMDPVPTCSLVPVSWWLRAGSSWARNLSRSDGLIYAHRCWHSWETSSLWAIFGYGMLWHRISSVQTEMGRILSEPAPGFLCPEGFRQSLRAQEVIFNFSLSCFFLF